MKVWEYTQHTEGIYTLKAVDQVVACVKNINEWISYSHNLTKETIK